MDLDIRKGNIIEKVKQMDEASIEKMESYLQEESLLSESLDRSIAQVESGQYRSHAEIRKKYQHWL